MAPTVERVVFVLVHLAVVPAIVMLAPTMFCGSRCTQRESTYGHHSNEKCSHVKPPVVVNNKHVSYSSRMFQPIEANRTPWDARERR
jgi:hypothetical protein